MFDFDFQKSKKNKLIGMNSYALLNRPVGTCYSKK